VTDPFETDHDAAAVVRAEVLEVGLPLREPFVTSFGPTDARRVVLVKLTDADGRVGWGEAAPLDHPFYLPDTVSSAFAVIVEYALPLCLRAGAREGRGAAAAIAPIRGNTFARAGVEQAFWVLESLRAEQSLSSMLGATRDRIPVGESIGIKPSIDDTLVEVRLRLDEGYRRIKLKIAPGWDVGPVRAVREAFGPAVMLQVDANAAYAIDDAEHLAGLDEFELACIEQPLGYDDLFGHAELQRRLTTPICLDESLRSPADVRLALRIEACRNVNLKPGRVGGLAASLEIHDACVEHGVPLWCGGMLESGIGRAANIAMAGLPGFTEPADMSPASVLYHHDLVDPTYAVGTDGYIDVPAAPGLGFPVAEERIGARTLRHVELDGSGELIAMDDGPPGERSTP
jgi:O-succinylbenzoate synthase